MDAITDQYKVTTYNGQLLESARTQWQFGDWQSLAKLDNDQQHLDHHPQRAELRILATAGTLQTQPQPDAAAAKAQLKQSLEEGASREMVARMLIAGVYNSLGKAAAIDNKPQLALQHFEKAIKIGVPSVDPKLLTEAWTVQQLNQLGLATGGGFEKFRAGLMSSNDSTQTPAQGNLEILVKEKYLNFSSEKYWEERYQKGGTSGYGSYGRLAKFKAEVINKFIEGEGIDHVIELGCGDGNQLSMLNVKKYVGIDISLAIVDKCKERFKNDRSKLFLTNSEYLLKPLKGELALSLDVIFHLIEDDVFEDYMKLLFSSSTKYCIIYASDSIEMKDPAIHVRHRKFTNWIKRNIRDWRLMQITYNKYPHDGSVNPKEYSFSDFYFYERY